ncbi:TolC family protein [Bacteroides eggerthii]|uniref:TolC family protein n=2 Tax=Bacteroidales TaxID=171549 RepID=A0ABT7U847_9BACE|nr:TolC family protein [Bacteroides eggerthii]
MSLRKGVLLLWALCFGTGINRAYAGEVLQLTLDEALKIALSDNPTIKVADQDIELKKVSAKEAWQSLLPTVDLNGTITYTIKTATMNIGGNQVKMGNDASNTWNGALNVSLPLYAPAVYRTMKMTRDDIELAAEKSRASRLDLINQVTKAYYQLMLAQDSYAVLQKSYSYSEENYEVVKAKFEQGSVSEYDKISAEVQMRNMKPNVVSAANAVNLAKTQLKVLLGIGDPELEVEVQDNLKNYEQTVHAHDPLQQVSLEQNTTLRQFTFNEKLLNHSLRIQKSAFIPTLALNYQYQYQALFNQNFQFWNYNWTPSSTLALTLSIPLYHADNFTKMKTIRIQQQQLAENRVNTERQLNMQVQTYLDNMQASNEQMASNKESVAQAEKGLLIAQKRYDVGRGTILELNSSEVALTQAELTYNQAIYDYLTARADLDYLMGTDR